ncbi:Crp/Fnr family transcriptional regulator [Pedobacter aquatilis]|uniref:Crp/Fnr family transcriptional regulator n=1 Tax=Pedobacter aquatilis TaxID=351343 RepID=UPI00292F11C7|nr:cyclic nucleotide-binding domain-containing protein [Pedobacter aquatilis]
MYSDVLNTVGIFEDWERRLFEKEVKLRYLDKNEPLLKKGDIAAAVFFNLEGSLYQHIYNEEKGEAIIDLHLKNEWVLNHKSFLTQQPANSTITSYSGGTILELSIQSIHYLIGHSLSFLQLNKIIDTAVSRIALFDHALTPREKYIYILNTRPQLIQEFPLKMIASYLKITPETISRVREIIFRDKGFY